MKHIKEAASDRYAPVGGYMHMVAGVHLKVLVLSDRNYAWIASGRPCHRWMQACWCAVVPVTVDSPEKQRVGIIA